MIKGIFTLKGACKSSVFETEHFYSLSEGRGDLSFSTDLPCHVYSIPSRDKQVKVYGAPLVEITTIDSTAGANYKKKLSNLGLTSSTPRLIVNETDHGSFAILGCEFHTGLHDIQTGSTYYVFGDTDMIPGIVQADPLRYLLYRFPASPIVFIQAEGICSKWWRWTSKHSLLHAFNALEHRLHGSPQTKSCIS